MANFGDELGPFVRRSGSFEPINGAMTQTQKIITHKVLKIHKWKQGDMYELGKIS